MKLVKKKKEKKPLILSHTEDRVKNLCYFSRKWDISMMHYVKTIIKIIQLVNWTTKTIVVDKPKIHIGRCSVMRHTMSKIVWPHLKVVHIFQEGLQNAIQSISQQYKHPKHIPIDSFLSKISIL